MTSGAGHPALDVQEILERILGYTIRGIDDFGDNLPRETRKLTKNEPPWPFLLVCKHWRQVVMTTPSLWSTFVVALPYCTHKEASFLLPLFDVHVRRSNPLPLTLAISLCIPQHEGSRNRRGRDPKNAIAPVFAFLQRVMEVQSRWRVLHLFLRSPGVAPQWTIHPLARCAIRFRDMHLLEKLSLDVNAGLGYWNSQRIQLGPCPRLQSIKLVARPDFESDFYQLDSTEIIELFPNLRTVSLDLDMDVAASDGACWSILRWALRAERLELKIYTPHNNEMGPITPIDLPFVQSLSLNMNCYDGSRLLRCLTLPSLMKLELDGVTLGDGIFSGLASVLRNFPVEDLTLTFVVNEMPISLEVFEEFLRACGGVQNLSISKPHFFVYEPALLVALTAALQQSTPDKESLLPQLSYLEVEISLSEFYEMIDLTSIRQLVLACENFFSGSDFDIVIIMNVVDSNCPDLREEIAKELEEDEELRSSVSESFGLRIDVRASWVVL